MKTLELKTEEPIKIELYFSSYGDSSCQVLVDGYFYVVFDGLSEEMADFEAIRYWVEETYDDTDYNCEDYVPGYLRPDDFLKEA